MKKELEVLEVKNNKYYLEITSRLNPRLFIEKAKSAEINIEDPNIVLGPKDSPIIDKYDELVPTPLLRKTFLKNEMDVPAAMEILRSLD